MNGKASPSIPAKRPLMDRADWHDYRSKAIYLVTLSKNDVIPAFCTISGVENGKQVAAQTQLSGVGKIVCDALTYLKETNYSVELHHHCVMPGRIHILMEVTRRSTAHLDDILKRFKDECNSAFRSYCKQDGIEVFRKEYQDRVLFNRNELQMWMRYMGDAPRRQFLHRSHPDYFRTPLLCFTAQASYSVCGNISLLEHPDKRAVRFSRKYSEEEALRHKRIWEETIRNGGVLVSPFIHPVEKEFLHLALDNGGKVIMIRDNGLTSDWKPSRTYMQAFKEGRILFAASADHLPAAPKFDRALTLRLNGIAASIAGLRKSEFRIRPLL